MKEFENNLWFSTIRKSNKNINKLTLSILTLSDSGYFKKASSISQFECYIANLAYAYCSGVRRLYVNRKKSFYSEKKIFNTQIVKTKIGYACARKAEELLCYLELITSHKGARVQGKRKVLHEDHGYIEITDKLVDLINKHKAFIKFEDSVIEVTDKTGKRLTTEGVNMIICFSTIKKMLSYNNFIDTFEIIDEEGVPLNAWLCRKFRDNLELHGRVYNIHPGKNYQQQSPVSRKKILIDGEPTVELDYSSLHCSLLYESKGLACLDKSDLYTINLNHLFDVVEETVNNSFYLTMSRKLVKAAFVRAINCDSKEDAVKSLMLLIQEDLQKDFMEKEFKFLKVLTQDDVWGIFVALEDKHSLICEMFYQKIGLFLMNLDSNILMKVLESCEEQGICALPIHDSVIVPESLKEQAMDIMMKCYCDVMGSNNNCVVKQK
jgi:hypothetical protein